MNCSARKESFVTAGRWSLLFAIWFLVTGATAIAADDVFRFGISREMMKEVHENDMKAAVRTWIQALTNEIKMPIDPSAEILADGDACVRAFKDKRVHAATLLLQEFLQVDEAVPTTNLLSEGGPAGGDHYVLLTHRDSGLTNLAALKGRQILVSDSMRMSLGEVWLDVSLMRQGFPIASNFFSKLDRRRKLANIVLPVFFRTADVCLVTRRGFDAMAEMNPQVGKQLRVLAASERVIAGLVCFRADCPPDMAEKVSKGLLNFHETLRGQQVLTLFQSGAVSPLPRSGLNSALELVAEHKRLLQQPSSVATTSAIRPASLP